MFGYCDKLQNVTLMQFPDSVTISDNHCQNPVIVCYCLFLVLSFYAMY